MDHLEASSEVAFDWLPTTGSLPTILIVEDEPMIGIELLTIVSERGGKAIGPFGSVEAAQSAIANTHIDGAIVDLDLNGEMSFDVANLLQDARIPFVIYTGIDCRLLPERHRRVAYLQKPSTGTDVVDQLLTLMD